MMLYQGFTFIPGVTTDQAPGIALPAPDPYGSIGVLVPDTRLDELVALLDTEVLSTFVQIGTDGSELFTTAIVTLPPPPPPVQSTISPIQVIVQNWDVSNNTRNRWITTTLEHIAVPVGRDVVLTVEPAARTGDALTVHLYCGAGSKRTQPTPLSIAGYHQDTYYTSYDYSYKGIPISIDGFTVAELCYNDLYILYNAYCMETQEEAELYGKILDLVRPYLELERKAFDTVLAQEVARESDETNRFVKTMRTGQATVLNRMRENRAQLAKTIEEYKQRMLELILECSITDSVSEFETDRNSMFRLQYERIKTMSGIESITFDTTKLKVITKLLYCTVQDAVYEMGKYEITIDYINFNIRCINLTRKVNGHSSGMHHPHVFSSGELCMGNIESTISSLFKITDLASILFLVIDFLQTANTEDSAGKHVGKWPQVDPVTLQQLVTAPVATTDEDEGDEQVDHEEDWDDEGDDYPEDEDEGPF